MNLDLPGSNTRALLAQWVLFCEQSSLSDSGHPGPPSTFHLPCQLVLKKLSLYVSRNRRHIVKTKPTPNHTFPATKGKKTKPRKSEERAASVFHLSTEGTCQDVPRELTLEEGTSESSPPSESPTTAPAGTGIGPWSCVSRERSPRGWGQGSAWQTPSSLSSPVSGPTMHLCGRSKVSQTESECLGPPWWSRG